MSVLLTSKTLESFQPGWRRPPSFTFSEELVKSLFRLLLKSHALQKNFAADFIMEQTEPKLPGHIKTEF